MTETWDPLEQPDTLQDMGNGLWTLNDLKGMKGKIQNRAIFLLLHKAETSTPFLAVINPPIMTEEYKELIAGLQKETGAQVEHLVSMGYKHHLSHPGWVQEFPQARSHMFPRDAAQPEQTNVQASIDAYDVKSPATLLAPLTSTGQIEVVLHDGVGDGLIPTFTGAKQFGPLRYNLWLYHKPSRSVISGCQAWSEAKEGGPEPWHLRKFFGMKPGTLCVWGKVRDKALYRATCEGVVGWDFSTHIPMHGPILRNAKNYIKGTLERHLGDGKL